MFERLRGPFEPVSKFIAKFFTWLHPNTISIIGFCIGFVPVYFFMNGYPRYAGLGILLYLFDFLDGAVARFTGKVSLFGEVLDASLDRITDGLIIFAIATSGFVSWNLAIFVFIGTYLVSYVRARTGEATAKKIKLDVGIGQRGDRIFLLLLGSIFYTENIKIPFIDQRINSLELVFLILLFVTWQTVLLRFYVAYKKLGKSDGKN